MINNVVIVGLGAIGSVYATALHNAGIGLKIAADSERINRYKNDGFIFNGNRYDFDYFTPSEKDSPADLVIIATKSSGLQDALDLIEPIVGSHTQILPLLNGITSEKICGERYSMSRVVYGYYMGHTATRYGNKVHQDGKFKTYFGEAVNTDVPTPRVEAIKSLFERAGISYKIPKDMIDALWQKFIVNIGMNQATAVLQCTYGHLQSSVAARHYMLALMGEAALVAEAMGVQGSKAMVEKAIALLMTLSAEDGSSMYQDVKSGRVTEVDLFADTLCRLGQQTGIATPYNYHASVILRALK